MDRLRALVYGTVLLITVGWVLHVGKTIFVPAVLGAVIGVICVLFAYLVMANKDRALALAPQYQQSLLATIQRVAVYFGVETEPTWATLRQELVARINLQRLFGSLLAVASYVVMRLFGLEFAALWAVLITAILAIVLSEFPGTRPIAVLLSSNGRL